MDSIFFKQRRRPRQCGKEGRTSSHNTLLQDAERISQPKPATKQQSSYDKSCVEASNESRNREVDSSELSFLTDVKDSLKIAEVEVYSTDCFQHVLFLCDSACSHSWISEKVAKRLTLLGG